MYLVIFKVARLLLHRWGKKNYLERIDTINKKVPHKFASYIAQVWTVVDGKI